MIEIEIADRQTVHRVDPDRLAAAAQWVLGQEGIARGTVSLAVVDDATIRALNRRYLQHDYATDVLSFVFERSSDCVEGEIVVSAQTAAAVASDYGWSVDDELLLYVVHGVLHLCGYDDREAKAERHMRARERKYLARFDLVPQYEQRDDENGDEQKTRGS